MPVCCWRLCQFWDSNLNLCVNAIHTGTGNCLKWCAQATTKIFISFVCLHLGRINRGENLRTYLKEEKPADVKFKKGTLVCSVVSET